MHPPIFAHGDIWTMLIIVGIPALAWTLALYAVVAGRRAQREARRAGLGMVCGLAAMALAGWFTAMLASGDSVGIDLWSYVVAAPIGLGAAGFGLSLFVRKGSK